MLEWYFDQSKQTIWLSTSPNTRAAQFYKKSGWKEKGIQGNGEIRFEMSYKDWKY